MEEKKTMSIYTKGILISMIVIVLGIAGYLSGIAFNGWYNWAVNGLLFIGIVIACIHFANENEGFVTFGKVFSHGFKVSAFVAIILVIYSVLSMQLIFPEIKEKAMEMSRQQMEEKGNMTDDQIDQAISFTKKYFLAFAIFGVLIGTVLFGLVASLVGAALAKKKPVNPMDNLGS